MEGPTARSRKLSVYGIVYGALSVGCPAREMCPSVIWPHHERSRGSSHFPSRFVCLCPTFPKDQEYWNLTRARCSINFYMIFISILMEKAQTFIENVMLGS